MEQALVFASIMLGVAIASELTNLHHLLRAKQVIWHWAQPAFAIFVLLNIVAFWWGAANNQGSISFARFLPILLQLVLLVLLAAVSLPDKIPDDRLDLGEYYHENRRYQWILFSLYFWSIHIGFVARTLALDISALDKVAMLGPDTIAGLIAFGMIFAQRWRWIALGFAFFALSPIAWAARTLG
ncbi:hypothetical protein K3163_10240 [Qipengyuania sp. 1NDW9]|nr:hypothetical protein [Qipengyuania xiapuensis]